jgi:hypothetical protein
LNVGDNQFAFDVTNLQGITVLDKKITKITATVTVSSSYSSQTVSVDKQKIIVEGIPTGYKAVVKSISTSNISVISSSSDTISSGDIELKCDVSNRSVDNVYSITSRVTGNNSSWVYGKYTATIELVKE